MRWNDEGIVRQIFYFDEDQLTGKPFKRIPLFPSKPRFACVFVSRSVVDAAKLNNITSANGIRTYHARDARQANVMVSISTAPVLLIDLDEMEEPWFDTLQDIEDSHPGVPVILLTGRSGLTRSFELSKYAFDFLLKPVNLGDLLISLEDAHWMERELNDPARVQRREEAVLAPVRADLKGWPSILRQLKAWIGERCFAMIQLVRHERHEPASLRIRKRNTRA
jgi:ActR/RegA family two-component response regulator